MSLVVDLCEVLEVEVGVDLRGADIRVAKQFLHGTQVAAGFQQVTGKGVAQDMGRYFFSYAGNSCLFLDNLPEAGPGHACAAACNKYEGAGLLFKKKRSAVFKIIKKGLACLFAKGDEALFVPFAKHPDKACLHTHCCNRQRNKL